MKQFYPKGLEHLLNGDIDYTNDRICVAMLDLTKYTPDFANDEYLSDIPETAIVASALLDGKTNVKGVADANDTIFVQLTGAPIQAYAIFVDTYNRDTSMLIVFNDGKGEGEVPDADTLFPIVPDGTDYTLTWPETEEKIFAL